jgi:hypothetical protein
MTPKEIGRKAGRIFGAAIPYTWVIRSQQDQEDYGVDYELELMLPGDKPSGFLFKVQEKGALDMEEDAGGTMLVFGGLKVARMRYYLRQLDVPIALVLVDITKGCVWWAALQGNPIAEERYTAAAATTNETMTMYVPKANALPGTEDQFIEAMRAAQDALTVRCVREATSPCVVTAALNTDSLDDTVAAFRRHSDSLRLEQVERFRRVGDLQSALDVSERIWESPSETIQLRFAAAVNIVRFMGQGMLQTRDFDSQQAFMRRRVEVTTDLVGVTEKEAAPEHLRLYAKLLHSSANLSVLVDRYMGFAHSESVQPKEGVLAPITRAAKQHSMVLAFREFERGQGFLAEISQKARHLVAQSWSWLVSEIGPFALILRMDRQREASDSLIRWIDDTVGPIVDAAAAAKDWESVALCAMEQVGIGTGPDPAHPLEERVARAKELLGRITDQAERQGHEERLAQRAAYLAEPPPPLTIEREQDFVRHMASATGLDLDDESDPFAQMARLGIEDMNPERVLRNCRHLFVCTDSYGLVREALGLPTAGMKWINCTKHGHSLGHLSLDGAYGVFHQDYCSKCPDACPHPTDWRWSHEWQQQQDQANLRLIERCRNFGS